MEAALRAGVQRVVHTSSIAAVGYTVGRGLSNEATGFNQWDVANDYILSKYMAELEALGFAARGLDVVAVNPAFPLGGDDRAPTPTGKLVADMLAGSLPFVVDGGVNVVAATDVAAGHLAAARRGVAGQRYILGGHNVTFKQLGQELGRLTGQRAPRLELPTTVAKAWGWANEQWSDKVSKKAPTATFKAVSYTAGRYVWFSSDKAERDLGYTRSPLAQALQASVDWFRRYPV